jgi:RHS repeat-associated protein
VVPLAPLTGEQTYTLTVRPGLADVYGNTLVQPFAASFRARAAVNPNLPFTLTLNPVSAVGVPGGQASYIVSATLVPGKNFAGLISLAALGLPAGVSGSFERAQIAPGQTTTLNLAIASTTALASATLTVRGSSVVSGQTLTADSNPAALTVTSLGGSTVVYGRVLSDEVQPRPLTGVIIRPYCRDASTSVSTCDALDPNTLSTTTDASGYFALSLPQGSSTLPSNGTLILFVDGRGSSNATQQFAAAKTTVPLAVGQWNTVPFDIHLPVIKPGTTATSVTGGIQMESSAYPNTRVFVPDSLRLYSYIEQKNVLPSEVQISAVDPGKLPQPLPGGVDTPMASTIQPGGTVAFDAAGNPTTIPVIYANLSHELPGTRMELWSVSRDDQWYQYGYGVVSDDGRRIEPKPCEDGEVNGQTCAAIGQKAGQVYGLLEFSWHFPRIPEKPDQPTNSRGCPDGTCQTARPVDNATGTFYISSTDIGVRGGRMPFSLTRSYRSLDSSLGMFGTGTSTNFDIFLRQVSNGAVELVLPENARYLFSISSTGTSYINETEIAFRGDTITKNSDGYIWRTKNGQTLAFNSLGLLLTIKDRNGNTITINRLDSTSSIIASISSASGSITIGYTVISINGQTTQRIDTLRDQDGRTVSYSYNSQNQLIKVTRPDGRFWNYAYNSPTGFMVTATDPRGNQYLKNTYDSAGRVVRQEQSEGRIYQWQYIQNNPTVSRGLVGQTIVTLPNGNTQIISFDGSRYPIGSTDGLGQSSQVVRAVGTNEITSSIDSIGRTNSVAYDSNGNVISTQDAQGNIRRFTYESQYSLPISITDSLNHTSTIAYDPKGNPVRMSDALGHGATLQYDQFGQLVSLRNDVDGATSLDYDTRGRVIAVTAALGRTTSVVYDNLNRVTANTDPLGRTVQYQYDILNRPIRVTYPDSAFVTMTYDQNGNLKSLSDEKGQTTSYDYDTMNRLVKRTNPLGQFTTYQYDFNSQLARMVDRQGRATTFTYNNRDEPVTITLFDGTVINRTYDAVGRLVSLDDSRDGRIDWQYDILDRVIRETTGLGTVQYAYDSEDRRTSLNAQNGYSVSYSYDAADQVSSISKGNQTFQMTYDAAGRMTSLLMPNGITASYSFDTAGRLSRLLYQKGSQSLKNFQYSYDGADQITQIAGTPAHTFGEASVTNTAINDNNQYTAFGDDTLTYDASGNLKTKGQTSYQWDVRDRLIGIAGPNITASFSYDPSGRRTSRTVNGQYLTYQYDGADIIQDSSAQYLQGVGIDDVLSRSESGNDEYYLKDHLGSTISLMDLFGNPTTQYSYSPYGQVNKTGTSRNYFTYTGREDDSTGLYFYRARYYGSNYQRFISEDPIGFDGGDTNLYAYVGGNPVNATDPIGFRTYVLGGGGGFGGGNIRRTVEKWGARNNTPAKYPVQDIDSGYLTGDTAFQIVSRDLQRSPLKSGEPINIIAYSNGNRFISDVIAAIVKAKVVAKINLAQLDPSGATYDDRDLCDNVKVILSNTRWPSSWWNLPDLFASNSNYEYKAPAGVQSLILPDGVSHRAIPDRNGWMQWLRIKGFRF